MRSCEGGAEWDGGELCRGECEKKVEMGRLGKALVGMDGVWRRFFVVSVSCRRETKKRRGQQILRRRGGMGRNDSRLLCCLAMCCVVV
jgi:hypothetical protein